MEIVDDAVTGLTPEGAEGLTFADIRDVSNVLIAEIVGNMDTIMSEWGTGSLMDTSNPDLAAYQADSDRWNPERVGNRVYGRKKGDTYINIYGKKVTSTGLYEGVDMEAENFYIPTPPSNAVRNATRWMKNGRLQEIIQSVLATFPYHKYIITDNK